MRRYQYIAVDREGHPQRGDIQAASLEAAQRILSDRGWTITQLDSIDAPAAEVHTLSDTDFVESRTAPAHQPLMAVMSLRALSEELSHAGQRRAINELATALQGGAPVGEALAAVRSELPARLSRLIELGLKHDRLDWFVEHYLESTRLASESRYRLFTALGYPAMAATAVSTISLFFLLYIVPLFEKIFTDFGTELPGITMVFIDLSRSLRGGVCGVVMLGLLALGIGLIFMRVIGGAVMLDRLLAEIPVIGAPVRYRMLSDFCELLALLVEARLSLPEALEALSGTIDDTRFQAGARRAASLIRQGIATPTAAELRGTGWPNDLGDIFRWANRTDDFVQGLRAASEIFRARSRVQGNLSAWLLEPVLLLLLSVTVGLMVIALFMPLIKLLNDLS